MPELLLPRLKQEIEARLAELRPLIAEIEQLEAAKEALLTRGELPAAPIAAPARRRAAARNGGAARRRARPVAKAPEAAAVEGERAPRGANRDAILTLVEERPGVSVAEIASVTKIAKPTVATTVSKLKREGVLADEAGGVKLASRQALTLSGAVAPADAVTETEDDAAEQPAAEQKAAPAKARRSRRRSGRKSPKRDQGASDAEWDAAKPAADDDDA